MSNMFTLPRRTAWPGIHHKHNRFSLQKKINNKKPSLSLFRFNCAKKWEQKQKNKTNKRNSTESGGCATFHTCPKKGHPSADKFGGRLWTFQGRKWERTWAGDVRESRGELKMPLIAMLPPAAAAAAAARQKLADYEHAKWDGFRRRSPSARRTRITLRKMRRWAVASSRLPVRRAWQSWESNRPPSTPPAPHSPPAPPVTRPKDLNSLVSLSNSRVSLAG